MNGYELNGDTILRDGNPVANYNRETGSLDFLPDMAKYRMPVVKFLKAMDLPVAQPTGNVTRKTNVPEDAVPDDSKAAQSDSEAQAEDEVAKAKEVLRKAGLLPAEAPVVSDAQVALEKRLTEKVVKGMVGEPICDPVHGWIRG